MEVNEALLVLIHVVDEEIGVLLLAIEQHQDANVILHQL